MRLLLTRPRAESEALGALLAARGHECLIEPMLEIAPTGALPDLAGVAALIATSANGLRAFAAISERRDLPVIAVGDATASVARAAGFDQVESAGGGVAALARHVAATRRPTEGALLHLAGRDTAGDLPGALAGFTLRRVVLYEARAATVLSAALRAALADLQGALFFSPRSAATFVTLLRGADLSGSVSAMTAYCLSRAVADEASPLRWRAVAVAARPDQAALLDLLAPP
jgi:uroporphyrinogen-III synthase